MAGRAILVLPTHDDPRPPGHSYVRYIVAMSFPSVAWALICVVCTMWLHRRSVRRERGEHWTLLSGIFKFIQRPYLPLMPGGASADSPRSWPSTDKHASPRAIVSDSDDDDEGAATFGDKLQGAARPLLRTTPGHRKVHSGRPTTTRIIASAEGIDDTADGGGATATDINGSPMEVQLWQPLLVLKVALSPATTRGHGAHGLAANRAALTLLTLAALLTYPAAQAFLSTFYIVDDYVSRGKCIVGHDCFPSTTGTGTVSPFEHVNCTRLAEDPRYLLDIGVYVECFAFSTPSPSLAAKAAGTAWATWRSLLAFFSLATPVYKNLLLKARRRDRLLRSLRGASQRLVSLGPSAEGGDDDLGGHRGGADDGVGDEEAPSALTDSSFGSYGGSRRTYKRSRCTRCMLTCGIQPRCVAQAPAVATWAALFYFLPSVCAVMYYFGAPVDTTDSRIVESLSIVASVIMAGAAAQLSVHQILGLEDEVRRRRTPSGWHPGPGATSQLAGVLHKSHVHSDDKVTV